MKKTLILSIAIVFGLALFVGTAPAQAADQKFVTIGTDGVFDRVDKSFPLDVLRGCIQFSGNLQSTAEHVLGELALFQDGAGYICDDNLTLGLMGNGIPPRLSTGLWSPGKENTNSTADGDVVRAEAVVKEDD